ncbi:hypothetical protein H2202_008193 [Exophiala xenobiotica]|nr:hypothetical protein H2202_008193 [Exophiala xenobiotica]
MNEPVGPDDAQNATVEPGTEQTTTDGPTVSVATPSVEEMAIEVAPPVDASADQVMADVADADAEGDSEAETLIQSPEKQRTAAGSAADNASVAGSLRVATAKDEESTNGATATDTDNKSRKRKRSIDDIQDETAFCTSSRRSSPLSSPRLAAHSEDSDSDLSIHIAADNIRLVLKNRQTPTPDSDDEEKPVKNQIRRRRPSDILPDGSKQRTKINSSSVDPATSERRETRSATYPRHSSPERSASPPHPPRRKEHRRGVSTQLTLGDVERKKRGRPPAIHTKRSGSADHRRRSISSDESDSPRRLRPTLHKFASADQDIMSPAKSSGLQAGPNVRKWRDRNGRTFLARAANNNDLELVKQKLAERPGDLNQADNAGNTPLQIAALEGFADIVKFLLENGCEVDSSNIDRETPLIDAVENGHLEVVKLLLEHGANPRRGNAKGEEPFELVPAADENYEEIRRLLLEAKEKPVHRRASTDHIEVPRDGHSSRAASAASPRDSPPIVGPRSPPALASSRRRTGRSESTRNDLLWQANTQENLTRLAAKGDSQGVANILNILQKAETESLIAAAKAGHEEVVQFLLSMGDPEPDPDPVRNLKLGYNTPMLAAIGRGHPEVVKLLLAQSGFNPTRKLLKGKTYYEVAAERKGEQWQKEYDILKDAFDKYAAGKPRKTTSPRATRDTDKQRPRTSRRSHSPLTIKLRKSSSPTLAHKSQPIKSPQSSTKDADRESVSVEGAERRKFSAARKERNDVAVSSDQDQTVAAPKKGHIKRRSQSDAQPTHLDVEGSQRRRRLVTGKEHRRRQSAVTEESSGAESSITVLKRDSRPNTALKRTRDSLSPAPGLNQGDGNGNLVKKRRTVIESSPEETRPGPQKRSEPPPASETDEPKPLEELMPAQAAAAEVSQKVESSKDAERDPMDSVEETKQTQPPSEPPSQPAEPEDPIKTEEVDVGPTEAELEAQRREEQRKVEEARRLEEEERIAAEKAEEERKVAEENERRRQAEEEAAQRRREEEERQERIKRELEERQRRQEEHLRQQRLEYERRRREALPVVLSTTALMIDNNDPTVRSEAWLRKFLPLFTVKTSQLLPDAVSLGTDDLWIPNFQVAGLLATKDLNLRNYTSLEKRPVTPNQRLCIWKVSRNMLSFEYNANAFNTSIQKAREREEEEWLKFINMEELFWVKFSDFEDQVFRHPHLASLQPLKKQAISVRIPHGQLPVAQSPQPNGIFQHQPKLTNGISPHMSPSTYGNGNGYAR